jgi:ubiquinone/menaquinone biosynthesis C-methylase UbiE
MIRYGEKGEVSNSYSVMSEGMLAVAREKAAGAGVLERLRFEVGDISDLPFEEASFDVALSTYSMCPLYDPERGASELFRVVKNGGLIGIAHSTEPEGTLIRWLADTVEGVAWRFPSLSLGCRAVSVLPALQRLGARVIFQKRIGLPVWPFLVFVVQKPDA